MESILEKTNVDINSILISFGLMAGRYQGETKDIRTTKFGLFNMWFIFILSLFQSIKWFILIFVNDDSELSNYLGGFLQYFGPKIFVSICTLGSFANSVGFSLIFYLASKNPEKMLYWLDHMQFNNETRCFHKLNLNVSHSKRFTKQFTLLWFIIRPFASLMIFFVFCAILGTFLIFKHDYYLYYFISIFLLIINSYYLLVGHWCGLTLVLFQVKFCLKFNLI